MYFYRNFLTLLGLLCCLSAWAQQLPPALDSLFLKGVALYKEQNYTEAAGMFNQMIENAGTNSDYTLEIDVYYKLGTFYDYKQNYDKALGYFFKVIDLANHRLDTTVYNGIHKQTLLTNTYNGIGNVYYNQRNWDKSEEYFQIAYETTKDNEYVKPLSQVLNNLGEIKRLKGKHRSALSYYRKAMAIKEEIQDSLGMSINLCNIGTTYLQLGLVDSAKFFYDKGDAIIQKIQSLKMLVNNCMNYMDYYHTINELETATAWGQKALTYGKDYVDLRILLGIYQELGVLYRKQNIIDSCAIFQKKWIELSGIINKQNNEKLALEIEAKFLIKEKEKELAHLKEKDRIEAQNNRLKYYFQWVFIIGLLGILGFTLFTLNLLRKKNKKLAESWEQINQRNTEKELLLKEIHHRVKNNLQVITSLLSLQSYSIDDPTIRALFSQSQHRINSMAMIHKMLYQSNDFAKINGKQYLEELVDRLVISFKGTAHQVQVEYDISELFFNIDTSIPLGLLINEIITNALKYGLPDKKAGKLTIKMRSVEKASFLLEIGDNGVGYTASFKQSRQQSLGLRLIQQLAVQLNGNIEKMENKKGTYYQLRFREIEAA